MEDMLLKFFDDQIDFEEFLIIGEDDYDRVIELCDKYRRGNEDYNWDGFLQVLHDNKISFEIPINDYIYF